MQMARRLITVASRWSWVASGGAVLLGTQLQIARRLITVASSWSWLASGGAVLLGNEIADC